MTKMNVAKLKSDKIRVSEEFKERIEKFIQDFYEQKGIALSTTQATRIIDMKIGKLGGLRVD